MLPQMNMRRVYLIARRDFLGYIKTWGFWLSFLMPILFGAAGFFFATLDIDVDPVRYEAILDETGQYGDKIKAYDQKKNTISLDQIRAGLEEMGVSTERIQELENIYKSQGKDKLSEAAPSLDINALQLGASKNIYVDPPSSDINVLKAYLTGAKPLVVDGKEVNLSSLLHIYEDKTGVRADFWSDNISNDRLKSVANKYFEAEAKAAYLESGGLSGEGLKAAMKKAPNVKAFDPGKSETEGGQAVTMSDQVPTFVSLGATMLLWLTIFSGAYMLLTSMLEEKLNKLLEMMLSTTRLSEIIFGKLIGVAALTITTMLPYLLMTLAGIILVSLKKPELVAPIMDAMTPKLIIFFFVYLVLGYLFYGALFIALGSLAESMQDAQTLSTPIILILTACIMVVPLSLNSPDSPLLDFAAWFPLSAPFANIARLHLDPPWWELILSAAFLLLLSLLVIWLAGRVFRYGVFSGAGVKGAFGWVKRAVLRRKA